jgi:hypothetical protein
MESTTQKISQEIMNKSFWRTHYDIYKTSGLSKAAYSRQNNLIGPRFIYWSRKFEMNPIVKTKPSQPSNFARIEIKEEKTQFTPIGIHPLCTLELGNAKRLMIHDISVIKMLLNSLGVN